MKRKILILLSALLIMFAVPLIANAQIIDSGNCGAGGDNVTWTLDDEGTLTISGTGDMAEFGLSSAPWSDRRASIKKVLIDQGIAYIGGSAFLDCTALTSVTIPDSEIIISDTAFYGCKNLTSITIPNSVISIGSVAFEGTAYYNNDDNWENGVLYIGNFLISTKIEISGDYKINTGTIVIADDAFNGCKNLTGVTIPDSVTRISIGAFSGCANLTNITIPRNIIGINPFAFNNCTALTDVYYGGSETDWREVSIDDFMNGNDALKNATIHYGRYDPIIPVTLTVTPSGSGYVLTAETDYDGAAYAAAYDAEGALISVVSEPFVDGTATVAPDTAGAAKIKFFVWTNTLQPVTLAKEITLN